MKIYFSSLSLLMKEAIMNILAANMFAYLVNTCSQQKMYKSILSEYQASLAYVASKCTLSQWVRLLLLLRKWKQVYQYWKNSRTFWLSFKTWNDERNVLMYVVLMSIEQPMLKLFDFYSTLIKTFEKFSCDIIISYEITCAISALFTSVSKSKVVASWNSGSEVQ